MLSKPRRILLVEDHHDSAHALSRLLKGKGHTVVTAGTCAAARTAFARETFDLVLLDVGLPDGDGCDLLRELMVVRKVPAVAITGYDMEDDVARIRAAGFVAHLTKPAIVPQLNELIATLSLDSLSVDSSIAERTGGPSPLLA